MSNEPATLRGRNCRERIIARSAQLVGERGVRGTSLDDIRASASVSKGQLYHYFANKEELILAVIGKQTSTVLSIHQSLLDSLDGWKDLERWCEFVIAQQEACQGIGGCPLGSLASELADQDEAARAALIHAFDQWEGYLVKGFERMRMRGDLRADANPTELAVAMMTGLQGGLLLTQTRRSTQPLRVALHAASTYVRTFASQSDTMAAT